MQALPVDLRSILAENADGPGPHGAKGMGESGLMPAAPAIANAIAQAIGVRLTALPLTPERVWQALRAAPAPQTLSPPGCLPPPWGGPPRGCPPREAEPRRAVRLDGSRHEDGLLRRFPDPLLQFGQWHLAPRAVEGHPRA